MNDAPKLLVEWSSPWQEFMTSIRPAMQKSPAHLAGEARYGLFPYRGMMLSWVLEAALLVAVIVIPAKLATLRPSPPPALPKYEVIYFSGDELPRVEDAGGAQSGRSGRAGGREAHHRTQTIRVARGSSLREQVVDAPNLKLPVSDSAVANLLAYKPVPGPPPAEGLQALRQSSASLQTAVVPPAPEVERDKMQATPTLLAGVIAPPPSAPQRDLPAIHLPGMQAQVVPPPVSAPERITSLNPRLTLPSQGVVAPPPQVTRDFAAQGPGLGAGEMQRQVVAPPVQLGNASLERHTVVGLGGTSSVVPPPVQLGSGVIGSQARTGLTPGGTSVVAPPPSASETGSLGGRGRGNRGMGMGGPMDIGSVAAPPTNGGSGNGTGIVVSSQPGSKVGVPGSGGTGSLAMSPTGGATAGFGGSGGGSGIGRGTGPGSGFSGEGPGAGRVGSGLGSDPNARGGISPYPGPGGAGSGTSGTPAVPGVSVRGGGNVVTLPSFASGANQAVDPAHANARSGKSGPGITVVATSRSGGAFNFYGVLKGDRVYTIYLETPVGTVVMQFADPTSTQHPYAEDLVAPEPLRADLPPGLPHARLVIACVLDRSGLVKNPHVLETAPAVMTAKVLAALSNWKFRPVLRGTQPIEVNAILGFNIDTNDRY